MSVSIQGGGGCVHRANLGQFDSQSIKLRGGARGCQKSSTTFLGGLSLHLNHLIA